MSGNVEGRITRINKPGAIDNLTVAEPTLNHEKIYRSKLIPASSKDFPTRLQDQRAIEVVIELIASTITALENAMFRRRVLDSFHPLISDPSIVNGPEKSKGHPQPTL